MTIDVTNVLFFEYVKPLFLAYIAKLHMSALLLAFFVTYRNAYDNISAVGRRQVCGRREEYVHIL